MVAVRQRVFSVPPAHAPGVVGPHVEVTTSRPVGIGSSLFTATKPASGYGVITADRTSDASPDQSPARERHRDRRTEGNRLRSWSDRPPRQDRVCAEDRPGSRRKPPDARTSRRSRACLPPVALRVRFCAPTRAAPPHSKRMAAARLRSVVSMSASAPASPRAANPPQPARRNIVGGSDAGCGG